MQIELIGCTSAGKSSLAENIIKHNHQYGLNLVTSYDFVLRWAHLDWIKNNPVRMLVLNLIALFACLFTLRKNLVFYRFVMGVILRLPPMISLFEKLKIARIVARNMGIDEIVRRNSSDQQVVLADEGTLHTAHYLFVHVSAEPDMGGLDTFIRLVPLPDVAIYVRQPESVLISRISKRGHKRIPEGAPALVNRFVKHGVTVFEKLIEYSNLEGRLLIVSNGEGTKPTRDYPNKPGLQLARKIIGIESTS
jgi:hypothetical protein